MPLIRPFAGLRPRPELADQVVAPPYDVVSADEARTRAAGKPWSFLHISRPEIDLPIDTDPFDPKVYAQGRENFERQKREGILQQDPTPCYYFYRLVMGRHTQVGLVAAASVAEYDTNRIRKHEFTRPDKEDDRVRQIEALNAQTGPVFLTYRHASVIDQLAARTLRVKPDVEVTADDGVHHSLWLGVTPRTSISLRALLMPCHVSTSPTAIIGLRPRHVWPRVGVPLIRIIVGTSHTIIFLR